MRATSSRPVPVLVVLGTRPEAIKLAPVVRELRRFPDTFTCQLVSTGQHREMVDQALAAFSLPVDVQLDAMSAASSLGALTARLFADLDALLEAASPSWVLVQGDTTSAMVAAVSAFYRGVRVGHVEAGLRTFLRNSPFPEEINRTFISQVADLHFAPTQRAADNLLKAGVAPASIHLTGNSVVDALQWVSANMGVTPPAGLPENLDAQLAGRRLLLVTGHRRESFGDGLASICRALKAIVAAHPDTIVVFPVHLNPNVRAPVHAALADQPRILLLPPLSYLPLVYLMKRSHLILTDSGGIQEEAPTLGKPVLILRETTERPEAVEAGCAMLVGTGESRIVDQTTRLLTDAAHYRRMSTVANPFGDGTASERIVAALATQ